MEYDNTTTNDTIDCYEKFRTDVFHAVGIVRAVSGGISVIASLLVILLIVLFKKYIFFTQRLILYLGIASMLNGLAIALQGATYYPDNNHTDTYCSLSGFVEQTTHWSLLLAVVSITLDIYLTVVHKIHADQKKRQVIYPVMIFLSPIVINVIPFFNNAYGLAGPWCWITTDCGTDTYGLVCQYILWYVPLYSAIIGIITIYLIVYISIKNGQRKYHGKFDPNRIKETQQMIKEIIPLIYYPIIFLLLQIPPTMNRIAEQFSDKEEIPLWFLHAFFSPLQGGLMCIVYAMDPETRARLRNTSWRTIFQLSKSDNVVSEYNVQHDRSDSANESDRAQYWKYDAHTDTLQTNY